MAVNLINREIGRRLKMRRRLLGLAQREVAERCGIKFQQIHKYEAGVNTISAARLVLLAHALEVSPSYFFDDLLGFERDAASPVRPVGLLVESRLAQDAA